MRNTTKLKIVLQDYTVDFSMDEDSSLVLTMFDKEMGEPQTFEDKSYSALISKAYGYANKQKKIAGQENS